MIPQILLSWQGLMVDEGGSFKWVPIINSSISVKNVIARININNDLFITGSAKERHTGYFSINQQKYLKDLGENDIEDIINYKFKGLDVFDVDVDNQDNNKNMTNVSYEIELDNSIDEIDDKIYFSPMMYLAILKNPFINENRKYAIDFNFPQKKQFLVTINFPENYQVEFLPEPVKIVFENELGSYSYRLSSNNNTIQAIIRFEINRNLIPVDKYLEVKEFYKMRVEKENEKVVLIKK